MSLRKNGDLADDDDLEISRMSEVRGQNWREGSVVSDPTIDDEPCINVLRAFEERADAEDYVRNTCLEEDVVTKVLAVRMYEWHPVLIHTKKFSTMRRLLLYTQLEELHAGKAEERKKIEKMQRRRARRRRMWLGKSTRPLKTRRRKSQQLRVGSKLLSHLILNSKLSVSIETSIEI